MDKTISDKRLINQQLINNKMQTPKDVVSWLGAMQAQDYNMAKWAIGIRRKNATNKMIEIAFNNGEILRTHVLRPTWHFVAPEDIRWMLKLSASRIKASMKSRDMQLGLDEEVYNKSKNVIYNALENKQLTRDELSKELVKSGIAMNNAREYHIMMNAELDGIICSGAMKCKKYTYALLDERVPNMNNNLSKDEALAMLAEKYFRGHSPTTLQDFVWWSGLLNSEAKRAVEIVKNNLTTETINSQEYFIPNSYMPQIIPESIHLLPAFDEYIIGYRDRKAVLTAENHSKAISSNGIFRPTILKNGHVIGIWKKTATKTNPVMLNYFDTQDKMTQDLVNDAIKNYLAFWG